MNRRAFSFSILSTCLAATSSSLSFGQSAQVADKDVFEGVNWRDIKCYYWEKDQSYLEAETLKSRVCFIETERDFFDFIRKNENFWVKIKSSCPIGLWFSSLEKRVEKATNFLFANYWQKFGSNSHLGQDDLKNMYYEKVLNKYFPDLNNKQS